MDRIRRVGNSAILSELAKKGIKEGGDKEGMESMNVMPDTVVGKKEEEKVKVDGDELKRAMKAANVVQDKVAEKKESVKDVRVRVSGLMAWKNVDCSVTELVIASNCCNEEEVTKMDLFRFVSLKVFEVGDDCFGNVDEVKLIGLNQLERVVIEMNSFTKHKYDYGYDPNRHFYLKNCERLRELKIGCYSFSDYSVCEIENVPSLEVIEMGEVNEVSDNFFFASLELKSDSERVK